MSFFKIDDNEYVNVSHVRKVMFDGEFTRLYFSGMVHDCLKLDGDRVDEIINATATTTKPRR
jgi:hypothetical protein